MNEELIEYIFENYLELLTDKEKYKYDLILKRYKIFQSRERSKKQQEWLMQISNVKKEEFTLIENLDVKEFKAAVAHRILGENKVFVNRCPFCNQLARTTKARQAKCGHSWRDFELIEEDGTQKWVKIK